MSIINIFLHQSSYKERVFFVLTTIAHSMFQFASNGVAFYFQKPIFECKQQDQEYQKCSYQEACSQKLQFRYASNSPHNLLTEFNVVCENEYLRAQCISIMFSCAVIGSLILIFYKINDNRRFYAILLVFHLICLTIFQFQNNLYGQAIFLGLAFNLTNTLFCANFWLLSKQVLNEEMGKIFSSADGIIYGIMGILIPSVLYMVNGNIYMMIRLVIITQSSILIKFLIVFPSQQLENQMEVETPQVKINTLEIFQKDHQLIFNAVIQTFEYISYYFTVIYMAIEIQSFGGNIYVSMMLFEMSTIIANYLAANYQLKEKQQCLFVIGFLQVLYFFKNESIFFLFLTLVVKCIAEILFCLNMRLIFTYLPIETVQLYYGINSFSIRISLVLLPLISQFIKTNLLVNPLVIYGFMQIFSSFIQKFKIQLNPEQFDETDQEYIKKSLINIQSMSMRPNFDYLKSSSNNSLVERPQFRVSRLSVEKIKNSIQNKPYKLQSLKTYSL